MSEAYKTINYKDCSIKIYQDENYDGGMMFDDDNLFLVGFHREFSVSREGFGKDVCQALVEGKEADKDDYHTDEAKRIKKDYHFFMVRAYIHSGVSLSLSNEKYPYNDSWDSSWVGLAFASRAEWKDRAKAKKAVEGLITDWNNNLSGNVWGYVAESKNGNDIGSCWGFYGDYDDNGMIDEAKSEIDYYIKTELSKHIKRVKAQIKAGVPLAKRQSLAL